MFLFWIFLVIVTIFYSTFELLVYLASLCEDKKKLPSSFTTGPTKIQITRDGP